MTAKKPRSNLFRKIEILFNFLALTFVYSYGLICKEPKKSDNDDGLLKK